MIRRTKIPNWYWLRWLECHYASKVFGETVAINILPNGACNLKCPTCPVGNQTLPKGKPMNLADFEKILDKLQGEMKLRRVWLSEYTEPLLHPQCHKFIRELSRRGIRSFLSTNGQRLGDIGLCMRYGLSELRISTSGWTQKTYGKYHGGDVQRLKQNMAIIADILRIQRCETEVHVFFHRYKDNWHEKGEVEEYAKKFGFLFDWNYAYFKPVEAMVDHLNTGEPYPIIDSLCGFPEPTLTNCKKIKTPCRSQHKQLSIHSDGTVQLCCHSTSPYFLLKEGNHPIQFLETPLKTIRERQKHNGLCELCQWYGLHVFYNNAEEFSRE